MLYVAPVKSFNWYRGAEPVCLLPALSHGPKSILCDPLVLALGALGIQLWSQVGDRKEQVRAGGTVPAVCLGPF